METLWQDLKYGIRMLARSPGFAAVAILTLALGIGANTAIFSLIDAVLLRSLPVENPQQLVVLKWSGRTAPELDGYFTGGDCAIDRRFGAANSSGCSFSEPFFRSLAQRSDFSGVAAFANTSRLNLSGNGSATVISGQFATGDFFRTLGVKAVLGRVFEPSDDSPSATPVAVLNFGYWQSAFGGSRNVIGRTIELNNSPFSIIGIAEPRFIGITPGSDYDVWLPLSQASKIDDPRRWHDRQSDATFWWLTIVARLTPGMPRPKTQAAVTSFFRNQMLHGATQLFHGGNAPGMPSQPLPMPGNGPARRERAIVSAPPPAGSAPARVLAPQSPAGASVPQDKSFHGPMQLPAGKMPLAVTPPQQTGPAGPGPVEAAGGSPLPATPDDIPEVVLMPAQSGLTGDRARYSDPLYVLMLAVGIILLVACANIAGLMLARAAARRKEIAVRLALGAARVRIVRQLLTESVLLSVLGGLLGILFAYWGAQTILSFVSSNQPRPLGFAAGVDLRVLGFTLAVSLLTGVLFGIAPAFRGARVNLMPALKEGEGSSAGLGRSGRKWFSIGNGLVVAQVALAIVVLVAAGLLVRTLQNLRAIDIGFDSHNILIFRIDPTLIGYKVPQADSFYRDLQGRLMETPGIGSVSYSMMPLLSGGLMVRAFHWPGTPQNQFSLSDALPVGPNFFETLHIPFLIGRSFNAADFALSAAKSGTSPSSAPSPVIVNQEFVEKYLGKENPLGKRFGDSPANEFGPSDPGFEIVGVVRDAKYSDLRREIHATMYTPQSGGGASFELRTAADPRAILPAVRNVVAQLNGNLPLFDVKSESEQIDRLLFQERLVAQLSSFFGLLALVLACIGLYGLLSYEVARRTREIGIRMALGAQPRDVFRLVVGEGIILAIVGAVVGLGVALGVTRYLASFLYEVHANDPLTIVTVAILLLLVGFAACYVPARRAMRVDPMVALRYE